MRREHVESRRRGVETGEVFSGVGASRDPERAKLVLARVMLVLEHGVLRLEHAALGSEHAILQLELAVQHLEDDALRLEDDARRLEHAVLLLEDATLRFPNGVRTLQRVKNKEDFRPQPPINKGKTVTTSRHPRHPARTSAL